LAFGAMIFLFLTEMNSPLRYFYLGLFGISSRIYYRKLRVSGRSNFPKNGPVLVTANHSNAFWDAIIAGVFLNRHLWFLARSDVFKTPLKQKLLNAHGVLPIYRLQEGANSLEKNKEAFQTCYEYLGRGEVIAIFPEGNCFRESFLRPLKKGAARIAFGAAQFNEDNKALSIISIGLNFDDPDCLGSELSIAVSKPMFLADYLPLLKENPVIAVNKLTDDIKKQLDSVHINLHNKEHHALFFFLKKYFGKDAGISKSKISDKTHFQQVKNFADQFNRLYHLNHPDLIVLEEQAKLYQDLLTKNGLKAAGFMGKSNYYLQDIYLGLIVLIAAFPVFVIGALVNIVPYKIPFLLAKKIVKKREFFTSINLVVAAIMFLIWYLLLFGVFYKNTQSFSATLMAGLVAFLLGYAALKYHHLYKIIADKIRWLTLRSKQSELFQQFVHLNLDIRNSLKRITTNH
jgi:glycerol-3-phosphate O-acyltransferase / dihydroxyacetone phosphate acyltransferase